MGFTTTGAHDMTAEERERRTDNLDPKALNVVGPYKVSLGQIW